MAYYMVESMLGTRVQIGTEDDLKHNLFYPCWDRTINDMDTRFSGVGVELMKGIQACNPSVHDFLGEDSLNLIPSHNIKLSKEEIMVANKFLAKKKVEGTINMCSVYKLVDPDIPKFVCSCLQAWLRQTVGQEKLTHLALLSVEKDCFNTINSELVIDCFVKIKPRRHTLTIPPSKK